MRRADNPYGEQSAQVTDGDDRVYLSLSAASWSAGMTPEQARKLAAMLKASADRVEAGLTNEAKGDGQ